MQRLPAAVLGLVLFAAATACSDHHHHDSGSVQNPAPRPVSILVEVFDPITNFVWENVSVRVAEADQEWSGSTHISPIEDWHLTASTGQVQFDEFEIAFANVGFLEDGHGRAMLGPRSFEDEATVVIEVDAIGFTPKFFEIPLSWNQPDVFVQVPFN